MVTWEDVERLYEKAIRSFEELEKSKAECLLGIPASATREIFEDRWKLTVENKWGDPERVYENMYRHAKEVILDCARRSAEKIAVRKAMSEAGTGCLVSWNWSPVRGKCYIYEYIPFDKRTLKEVEIDCPREEGLYPLANMLALNEIAKEFSHCLVSSDGALAKIERKDGEVVVRRVWDIRKMVDEITRWFEEEWK